MKIRNKAFSLAELMIILLIFTIILAASMPVITRKKAGNHTAYTSLWSNSTNDTNDVFPNSTTSTSAQVVIGNSETIPFTSQKLVVNADASLPAQLRIGNARIIVNNKSGIAVGPAVSASSISGTGVLFTTCASSEALGDGAFALGCSSAGGSKSVAIGSNASANGENAIAIGRNVTSSGGGIALGQANAASDAVGLLLSKANGSGSFAAGETSTADGMASFAVGGKFSASASSDGAFALGQSASASSDRAIVIGPSANDSSAPGGITIKNDFITFFGTPYINGSIVNTSDKRLKNVQSKFTKGIDYIDKIQPYNFNYKKDKKHTPQVGVMAQDLQKVFPNSVIKFPETKYLSVCKEEMFYAMINSIKYLHKSANQILANLKILDKRLCILTKTQYYNSKRIDQLLKSSKNLQAKSEEQDLRIKKLERKIY